MKRYLLFALVGMTAISCNNTVEAPKGHLSTSIVNNPHTANGIDTVSAARKPTLDFTDTVHNFANIHQGESVTHDFTFVNNGKTPLIINNASGSCGCTVPVYPHDPVAPGKSGVIKVTFNSAGKAGHQEKSVTLVTNTVRGVHKLYIKGEVELPK